MIYNNTQKHHFMILTISFFTLLLSCSDHDDSVVSVNERTSQCGGFKTLSKRSAGFILPEDSIPCLEETLFWRYNVTSKVLTLIHRCVNSNCAAELSMSVIQEEDTYVIRQIDKRDQNISANCVCVFDLYCEIPGVSDSVVTLKYNTISTSVNLNDHNGKIIIHPLEYLDLRMSGISDVSILASFPQLKSLHYVDAKMFGDLSLTGLLPDLTSLTCFNVDSISQLASCTKLEHLELTGTPKLDTISALGNMTNLKTLYLYGISSLRDISAIGNCVKLEQLALRNCNNITEINPIGNCNSLKDLTISGAASLTTLEPLSKLIKLTNLYLDSIPKIASLEPLQSLSSLTSLSITNNNMITELSISKLNSLHQLNLVNITAVTDFTPLLSCLDKDDLFTYINVPVPSELLTQLKQKGVIFKGRDRL